MILVLSPYEYLHGNKHIWKKNCTWRIERASSMCDNRLIQIIKENNTNGKYDSLLNSNLNSLLEKLDNEDLLHLTEHDLIAFVTTELDKSLMGLVTVASEIEFGHRFLQEIARKKISMKPTTFQPKSRSLFRLRLMYKTPAWIYLARFIPMFLQAQYLEGSPFQNWSAAFHHFKLKTLNI